VPQVTVTDASTERADLRAWPADQVVRWKLGWIKPYPANALLHTPEQVAQIAASMRRFGVTAPVLVDEDGVLIYGHGRRLAAMQLGYTELPVSVARGWSEEDKRAYRIADNQLARTAEWDVPVLSAELKELKFVGFDLPLLGFPELKLVEFIAGMNPNEEQPPAEDEAESESVERELTPEEKALFITAWKDLTAEWVGVLERQEMLSTNYTKRTMVVHFLKARCFGTPIAGVCTLAYNPHRVAAPSDKGSLLEALQKATSNEDGMIEQLWWRITDKPRLDTLLAGTLPVLGYRLPSDFPSDLARALIDEFVTEPGGRVLDPCHGWGGRMLGFLLSKHARVYVGFDPDERTGAGVRAMFDDLKGYAASPKSASLTAQPFEDAKLPRTPFDFALTSPPYYDLEKYGGEQSSWRRYSTFEAWVEGFYRPLIVKTAKALKPGAVFALKIGNQRYPLERSAVAIASACGLAHIETRAVGISSTNTEEEEAHGEVTLILRKSSAEAASADPAAQFGKVL
jgi:ParB-like nuclease domain